MIRFVPVNRQVNARLIGSRGSVMVVGAPLTSYGGVIRRLRIWLNNLPSEIDLTVLYYSGSSTHDLFGNQNNSANVNIIRTTTMGRLGRSSLLLSIIRVFIALCLARPNTLVSFFPWTMLSAGIATRLARIIGIKTRHVLHLAGDPVMPAKPIWMQYLYRRIFRLTLLFCDDIVVLSYRLADTLRSEFNIPRRIALRIVPISIASHLRQSEPKKPNEVLTFGIVARLSPVKRCDVALRAFSRISKSNPTRFLIYGSGPEEKNLRQLCYELNISDSVSFRGWVDDPFSAFSELDCVLLPSISEGTPRAILEAASIGVPTIASSVGGIPDLIIDNETGWLTRPADEDDFVEKMTAILRDPEMLVRVGGHAKALVQKRPTHEEEVRQVFGIS